MQMAKVTLLFGFARNIMKQLNTTLYCCILTDHVLCICMLVSMGRYLFYVRNNKNHTEWSCDVVLGFLPISFDSGVSICILLCLNCNALMFILNLYSTQTQRVNFRPDFMKKKTNIQLYIQTRMKDVDVLYNILFHFDPWEEKLSCDTTFSIMNTTVLVYSYPKNYICVIAINTYQCCLFCIGIQILTWSCWFWG